MFKTRLSLGQGLVQAMARTLLATSLACSALAAHAGISVYTSQASFAAALPATGVDSFNDLSTGLQASTLARSAGGFTYTVTGTGEFGQADALVAYGQGGNVWLSGSDALGTITFDGFASNVNALGANFFAAGSNGAAQADQVLIVTAFDASGGNATQFLIHPSTTSFLGFVSTDTLVSVSVTAIQDMTAVWGAVDNVMIGSKVALVPEPAAAALWAAGLGALLVAQRRRRMGRMGRLGRLGRAAAPEARRTTA